MPGLLDKRLVFVTGKGGVGKSTVAAGLALKAQREGKRVLVCEVRAHERIPQLLGHRPVGTEITRLEPGIESCNIETLVAFREYALMKLRFKTLYKAVFENRVMRHALQAIPSIAEIVTLGKIVFHVGEKTSQGRPRWDVIIVDAPATGHALSLLRTPQTVLDAVPQGAMADELQHVIEVLGNPRMTGLVLVTLPEEMPVNETIELDRALAQHVRIERSALVLNGDLPIRFGPLDLEALQGTSATVLGPATQAARSYQRRSDLAAGYIEKLRNEVKHPLARVPFRFTRAFDRTVIEAVSHDLAVIA